MHPNENSLQHNNDTATIIIAKDPLSLIELVRYTRGIMLTALHEHSHLSWYKPLEGSIIISVPQLQK